MTTLSAGNNDIITESGVTIGSVITETATPTSYTNQTVIHVPSTPDSYTSEVYFPLSDQSFTIIENTYTEFSPDLPCSSLGSSAISFNIADYNGATAPTFVVIDSAGVLIVTAPSVSSSTDYLFYANSVYGSLSSPISKLIKLTVNKCMVANWLKCSNSNGLTWSSWTSGFTPSSGSWVPSSSSTSSSKSGSSSSSINKNQDLNKNINTIKSTFIANFIITSGISLIYSTKLQNLIKILTI